MARKKSKKKVLVVKKPWGKFEQFTHNKKTTVKILTIKKGGVLSLQSHKKRDELWITLDAGISVQMGNRKIRAKKGQMFFVKRGVKHRIKSSKSNARILEIAFGHFNEKDIQRFEDIYKRA